MNPETALLIVQILRLAGQVAPLLEEDRDPTPEEKAALQAGLALANKRWEDAGT